MGKTGVTFGLPVILDVKDPAIQGKKVLLTYKGTEMAVLEAEEVWKPDKVKEAKGCYGTTSVEHPSVSELFAELGKYYVGGKVHGLIQGFDSIWGPGFKTPAEVRESLPVGKSVVAFQNRNPVHKAHFELLVHAQKDVEDAIIFVHPTCGPTQPGDIDGPTRIKTYEVMQQEPYYQKWAGFLQMGLLALLDEDGRTTRSHPAHDYPQELWCHPFHHWSRYGRYQEHLDK